LPGRLLRGAYGPALGPFLTELLSPDRTTALLPAYLAILAALLAALLVYADGKGRYDRLLWALSVLGRTSLFTYVIQFVFVHSVPAWLGLKGTLDLGGTVALAAGATLLTWLCAYAYGRGRGWLGPDDYGSLRRLGGASPLGGGGVAAGAG